MPKFVIPVETLTLARKLDKNKKNLDENRTLSNLSAFSEENDMERKTMNRRILSVKERFEILEEDISRYFLNSPGIPFFLSTVEAHSPSELKMFP